MKKYLLLSIVVFISFYATAQQNVNANQKRMMDSIKAEYFDIYALKHPIVRQVTISSEMVTPGTIKSQLYDKDFFKGKLGVYRTTVNFNVPVVSWGKNSISASVGMINQNFKLNKVENYGTEYSVTDSTFNRTTLNAALSFTHIDSLFGVPVIFNVGAATIVDPGLSRQRFTYRGLISFALIRNANSSLSLGGLVIVDPSSPVPFVPFLTYSHIFKAIGTELLVDMPYRVALRKELSKKSSLTAVAELAGNLSFVDINQNPLPKNSIYTTLDLKTGMLFEHRLSKKVVLSISGGMLSALNSKVIGENEKSNNYFIKNSNQMVPYVNIGISLLPFFKGF
ncbi:hypothetical protein SAMN05518672_1011195 [Chitinophaga sp. CF118]|uniref:hypothetical protein n=1 Tax=Chitinophaga sp. CF118 TaxID=1884367 RepID=UPI0008ED0838|nr:hypothetical protein [Chitinophaga sp. CF118]SFD23774.1 hypothetical protein SAMN05518672_1011195 [Chitinophaga sp. CF118]